MKKLLFIILLPSLLWACSAGDESTNDESTDNTTASTANSLSATQAVLAGLDTSVDPESTTYQTLQGRALDLEVFAGKKIFVNFWATWCAPCIEEIPSIERAAAVLEPEGYVFLLASDEPIATISEFLDERGFAGNFIKLNPFFASYGISAVPSSILVNESGDIVKSWIGAYEWDSAEMLDQIRAE